jgi:hypothetical protein
MRYGIAYLLGVPLSVLVIWYRLVTCSSIDEH